MVQEPTRLKVHRYQVTLDGNPVTLLRLRPAGTERFATNYFHRVWHILSDLSGARLLGRVCWALAYQRRPGTLFVLHKPEVISNPFDADPSNAIVIANPALGPFNPAMAKHLSGLLRRPATPDGTVGLHTPGLDIALADPAAFSKEDDQARWRSVDDARRTRIEPVNGILVLAAPVPVLRMWGVELTRLGDPTGGGNDCIELDWKDLNGEVQVLPDFHQRVARAQTARDRLFPGRSHEQLAPDERETVWEATSNHPIPEVPD